MAIEKLYTVGEFEEFIARSENANRRFELINGEIVEEMPTTLHSFIMRVLTLALGNFLELHLLGWLWPELRYEIPGDEENARIPDLSFVRSEGRSFVDFMQVNPVPFMPDLAIEIQSPEQTDKLMTDKAAYYLANGSQMVWLVYSAKRLVEVLTLNERFLLTETDILEGEERLPGFSIPVADIFPKLQ